MHEYQGKWWSKKYPRAVCGTLAITQLDTDGIIVTHIVMRYGGLLKGFDQMEHEHRGELPSILDINNDDGQARLHFEMTECRRIIRGRYEVKQPAEDVGAFKLQCKETPVM
jgi:hypothetical protein